MTSYTITARAIEHYMDAQEPIRERVVGADGIARTPRREGCKRRLETRFGEVMVTRRGYGARGLDGIFPLDAELNLPPDKHSHGLPEAVGHLERAGGGHMAKRQTEAVAVGLRRAATRKQLDQGERKPVDKAANHIENNHERLRYDQVLAQGLPISTGLIEGACRHLVTDRMDITGARWGLDRAEAILQLHSLKISGDLESYLAFHFAKEQKRNYPAPPVPAP
jgi:hypothetical protein